MSALAATDNTVSCRLPHICGPALSFGLGLRRATDPGTADQLRERIVGLLAAVDSEAASAEYSAADVQLAKYALVAYLDEIVLGSHWDARTEWASRPLQLEYFNDFTAGEQFFNKLETVRQSQTQSSRDVLEVYALCLGLGFRGKYGGLDGAERLARLRGELARELEAAGQSQDMGLSPHWMGDADANAPMKDLPVWIVAAVAAGVLLVVFLVLDLILGSQIAPLEALASEGQGR